MPLPPFLRRKTPAAAPPAPEGTPEVARTRARRRLIGAVLLLGVGVIAFPLLFETEPRPIPVDLPIIVPPKDGAPPLAMPSASGAVGTVASVAPAGSAPASRPPLPMITETPSDPSPTPAVAVAGAGAGAGPGASSASAPRDDAARAQALLDGKSVASAKPAAAGAGKSSAGTAPAATATGGPVSTATPAATTSPATASPASAPAASERYVVQIGAFAEDKTVREVRAKAAKAGLDTFTQVVTVEAGTRTRVRIGPFTRRQEAEAAAAKASKAGLPASVLKL